MATPPSGPADALPSGPPSIASGPQASASRQAGKEDLRRRMRRNVWRRGRSRNGLAVRSARPGCWRGLAADEHRVARRHLARIAERVMQAAALSPLLRTGDDQARHLREVAQLQQIAVDQVAPVVLLDLAAQVVEPPLRAREPLVGPDDADVVPHQVANLVP